MKVRINKIFSGKESIEIWNDINNAKTVRDLSHALYAVCCKLQELEYRLEELEKRIIRP